jgi:tRNA threonylcarbamoyl adenosine modification protein YjeE
LPGLRHELACATRDATLVFARRLAGVLRAGDTLLLEGDLGAGKSEIARAIIQELMGAAVEVPSPTYTLVQHYTAPQGGILHADLYRLNGADELVELGLDDALGQVLLLVEWPERAGPGWFPASSLTLKIAIGQGEARVLQLCGDAAWADRLARLINHS